MKIGIVGAGGWGTALATVAAKNADNVMLWVREDDVRQEISEKRTNSVFLPGINLPHNIDPVGDFSRFKDCSIVLMVVPSAFIRPTAEMLKGHLAPKAILVNAAKGFELSTGNRLSVTLSQILGPENPVAVLSGPNHAEEISRGLPAATVVAATDQAIALQVQDALMTSLFRVYTNSDVTGVELGGALKNIIALAAGISDGMGYGDNTKAALLTRGMTEIVRLGKALGAHPSTFAGLSGMGDLIVTCTSPHSRNRRAGLALGQGKKLCEILAATSMVVEGVNATQAAYSLAEKHSIEMPITFALHEVLFRDRDPREAVMELMARMPKHETEELPFGDI